MIQTRRKEPKDLRNSRRVGCRLRVVSIPYGMVTDISEGGARFSFHHAISLDADFDVPIKISDRIIWARVHPVWAQPSDAPQNFSVGTSFISIKDEDREVIRQFIQKRMRGPLGMLSRFLWNTQSPV